MRQWLRRIWPAINDQESAALAVERAARIMTIWTVVNLALGAVLIWSGTKVVERQPSHQPGPGDTFSGLVFLLSGILFGLVAWNIRSMSRFWALFGLLFAALALITDLSASPSPIAFVIHLLILVAFINAVRGTFAFEKYQSEQQSAPLL